MVSLIAISLSVACASRSATQTVSSISFDPLETLVIAPDTAGGRVKITTRQRGSIVYPIEAREQGIQAQAIVAFVIDTTGLVEPGTMTFLNPVPPYGFQRALCDWASSVRYTPPLVDGQLRRVLTVQPWDFGLGARTSKRMPDAEPHRQRLRSAVPADAVAWLRSQPHCPR